MPSFKQILIGVGFCSAAAIASPTSPSLRLDPQIYAVSKGATEPQQQLNATTRLHYSLQDSEFTGHLEVETQGRRDLLWDIDRGWYRVHPTSHSQIYFGRIHPWEVSGFALANRPWSLLAQRQTQNRGLNLGYGLDPGDPSPKPILMGWIGAHWKEQFTNHWSFALSFTPIFLPSQGPAMTLGSNPSSGRFGRTPPAYVELNGNQHPLLLTVDKSQIWNEVIFQPQAAATLSAEWSKGHQTWWILSRTPSPDASFRTDTKLKVQPNDVYVDATVTPYFLARWDGVMAHRWSLLPQLSFTGSAFYSSDKSSGFELEMLSKYFDFSVLQSFAGESYSNIKFSTASYTDLLLQAEAKLPIEDFLLYVGTKAHPKQKDQWMRAGSRWLFTKDSTFDLGVDWFQGDDSSYFGEWRNNSRIYAAFQWGLP